ncbi:MAG: hypothetical protein ACI87W_001746 [Halieaceae bacterium]|jgi:hypothetical protein
MIWTLAATAAVVLLAAILLAGKKNGSSTGQSVRPRAAVKGRSAKKNSAASPSAHKSSTTARQTQPYAAVEVKPGAHPCIPALEMQGKRLLKTSAPTLPLSDCDHKACSCSFVQHNDRRSSEGSERRMGIGLQSELYGSTGEHNRRSRRRGRRSDDFS